MPTTTAQALPYPALADLANGPVAVQNLAVAVDTRLAMRFASAAARDAAITAPVAGMLAYTTTENTLWLYSSSAWRAVGADMTAWTAYTPAWTAATISPLLGNGTIAGRYKQIGKTVHFRIDITFGSTTTYGSGTHSFGLPVSSTGAACGGVARIANGLGNHFMGVLLIGTTACTIYAASSTSSTAMVQVTNQVAGTNLSSTGSISLLGTYEAA